MKLREKQQKALIIEDSEILISFYKSVLSKYNCVVDLAFTMKMAKEKISKSKYDLYIIDKKLPDGNAIKLLDEGICAKKVIIISAYLQRNSDVEAIAAEYNITINHIKHKPISEEELDSLIEEIFGINEEFNVSNALNMISDVTNFFVHRLKKMTIKHFLFTLGLVIFLGLFFPTLETWKLHQFHDKFHQQMLTYSENRFKNFTSGKEISQNTFIESSMKLNDYDIRIRIFPDNFIHVLISSPKFGSNEFWLTDKAYLKVFNIEHDDNFIDIFINTWKLTFKQI